MAAHVGIDIGSKSIKIAQLEPKGDLFALLAAGITPVPTGGMDSESENDLNEVAEALKRLIKDTRVVTKTANVSLPEKKVFTRFIKLPYLTDQEVDSAISWQAEPYIPIPIAEASLDYQILRRVEPQPGKPGSVEVLLVATPKTLVQKYMRVFEMAGITIEGVESEFLALSRAVCPPGQTVLLSDFGASTTSVGVVRDRQLLLSHSIATGGEALTRAVSTSLNMNLQQAEEYKKAYGLDSKQVEGKVAASLKTVFQVIIDEIKKALQYYKSEIGDATPVNSLILAGGGAGMPEIVPLLAESLGMEVVMGDPFARVVKDQQLGKSFVAYAPLYGVSLGLAENV